MFYSLWFRLFILLVCANKELKLRKLGRALSKLPLLYSKRDYVIYPYFSEEELQQPSKQFSPRC